MLTLYLVWRGRDVVHSDTVRRRNAASLLKSWLPPSFNRNRSMRSNEASSIKQATPVEPSSCASEFANENIAQAPGREPCATARGCLFIDLLAKVSELMHRLTERRSLGGLLADRAAVRSAEKA